MELQSINKPKVPVLESGIEVLDLGHRDYRSTWEVQQELHRRLLAGRGSDTLILVEHEPVYTLGKNADENHLLQNYPRGVKVYRTERGGDVTYHGPGQLVAYPILDLHHYQTSVSWYMRRLEEVIIATVREWGLEATPREGLTGVWVGDEKIAALGVRLSRWVTMHGMALNVNTDLDYYQGIIPCGLLEYGVTSMEACLGRAVDFAAVKVVLVDRFRRHFVPHLAEAC